MNGPLTSVSTVIMIAACSDAGMTACRRTSGQSPQPHAAAAMSA
jgi:hypothetical protein